MQLRNPHFKLLMAGFGLFTVVLYWNMLSWATNDPNEVGLVMDQGLDINQVDYGTLRSNCQRYWSTSVTRWLGARMDKQVSVIWEARRVRLHYQLMSWWVAQNLDEQAGGVDAEEVFTELHDKFGFPQVDLIKHQLRKRSTSCLSCAIVGDSVALNTHDFAKEIDDHKVVIRIGADPVQGYSAQVGSKTTMRIVTSVDMIKQQDKGSIMVFVPYSASELDDFLTLIRNNDKKDFDNANILIIHPAFVRYVYERWAQRHGQRISIKFMTVIFALHQCDSISMFGMYNEKNMQPTQTYWFEKDDDPRDLHLRKRLGFHDADYEWQIVEQMEMKNIIKIHTN